MNGAGIAGTALAYWLSKQGHDVLLWSGRPRCAPAGSW
ncbi:NAD(P)-binding protein [Lysobacter silvisoli]